MSAATHELRFNGALLDRGFWLYVWEITTPQQTHLYYVGRTGDSSSLNAQSPFNRMGQHLGFRKESNALRRQLTASGVVPEKCDFRLVAHGPVMEEGRTKEDHRERRDRIAAVERALALAMTEAGHKVINRVSCSMALDEAVFSEAHRAFAAFFPKLRRNAGKGTPTI